MKNRFLFIRVFHGWQPGGGPETGSKWRPRYYNIPAVSLRAQFFVFLAVKNKYFRFLLPYCVLLGGIFMAKYNNDFVI